MTVQVTTIGPGQLNIGADDVLAAFSSQCRSCTLKTSVNNGDPIDVLSGETVPGDRSEAFKLEGSFLQDFGQTNSVTEWLFDHRGEQHPFEFVPNNVTGRAITGTIVVEAIDIGGDVKTKPSSDFSFNLVGPPVLGEALDESA